MEVNNKTFLLAFDNKLHAYLSIRKPSNMEEQLSPDEKFHLITRNLQVSQADGLEEFCMQLFACIH